MAYKQWVDLNDKEKQIVKNKIKVVDYNYYLYLVKHNSLVDLRKNVYQNNKG